MKKIKFFTVILLTVSIFSCKKDYTCKCYLNLSTYHKTGVYDKDTIKATRKTADKHCAGYNLKAKKDGSDSLVCYAYTNNYK